MNKTCSRCLSSKPLEQFHKHPTASFGRKNICKPCCKIVNSEHYFARRRAAGKLPYVFKGGSVAVSTAKKGDVRSDGMVFWSKRKNSHGFQEWWMSREDFDRRLSRANERARMRYQTDPAFREKRRAENCTDKKRALKRAWNKRNRAYMDEFQSARRSKIQGSFSILTDEQKKLARDFYKFRDILNSVHGKAMFHVDHIVPIARGGKHEPGNLQITTAEYNVRKATNEKPR
jgi:hypothetical protein